MAAPSNHPGPWRSSRSHLRAPIAVGVASAATTIFLVRLLGASWPAGFPVFFPDSSSYLDVAGRGPLRLDFWFGERPIVTPFVLWGLGRNIRLVVLAQSLLYVAAFWWAVAVLWQVTRSAWARWLGVAAVAAVAVQPRFALWNTHVLSESLSISSGVAMVATWVWFADRPHPGRAASAWVITAAWALTRDSNVLVMLVGIVPAALAASRWWRGVDGAVRRRLRVGAVAMLVVALFALVAQTSSQRNRYPTLNVIGQRVLLDDELTDYYVGLGMPLDDALLGRTGASAFDDDSAFLLDPALAAVRDWARSRGQFVQLSTTVWFAPELVPEVWRDVPAQLAADHVGYDLFEVSERLPGELPLGLGGPTSERALLTWATVTVGAVALILSRAARRPLGTVLVLGIVLTAADVYVSWLGDSVEVGRHLVGPIARLSVLIAMSVVVGLDELIVRWPRRAVASGDPS